MSSTPAKDAPKSLNGVDVTALFETITAVKGNPEIAKFNFRAKNTWIKGDCNRTTMKEFSGACTEHRTGAKGFVFDSGEPAVLLGADAAPNPVEWLLHALIGCMTTTTAYHAAARGIAIEAIDSEIDGNLDLRGFLGISPDVRKGYQDIRVRMRVKTEAPSDVIQGLTQMSPVFDVVSKSVPVNVAVETY